ncbi:MAG TPA: radical SAM protein [Chloroflexi bacterium]|nr:radical SAM protein [Chloroflexota bacterium]
MVNRVQPLVLFSSPGGHRDYDCDCACVREPLRSVGAYAEVDMSVPWVAAPPAAVVSLDEEWVIHLNSAGPVGLVALNRPAQAIWRLFASPLRPTSTFSRFSHLPPTIVQAAIRTMITAGLLAPYPTPSCASPPPSTLAAWLHLGDACNLRCPYCYVPRRPARMPEETAAWAAERLAEIASRHGYRRLRLKYAGGEPSLNFSALRAAHRAALQAAAKHGLGLEAVLLTNGVDTPEDLLHFLAAEGIRLAVSLDGGPPAHNRLRRRRDGTPTYTAVTHTVDTALKHGLEVHVSITLTALNLDGIADAVRFAIDRGIPFNLNFYRECTQSLPSPLAPKTPDLIRAVRSVFALLESRLATYPHPLTGILDRAHFDVPHTRTCAAGQDYLVIAPTGEVAPCQMLVGRPWTDLQGEDPLTELRRRGEAIFLSVEERAECRTCPWRYACSGGCPLMRGTPLHKEYCRAYRTLYPELVKLEGRRLIETSPSAAATRIVVSESG